MNAFNGYDYVEKRPRTPKPDHARFSRQILMNEVGGAEMGFHFYITPYNMTYTHILHCERGATRLIR
jgi:hypothetical protein